MTILEAVNLMLEWIGQPAVAALDTGGTSDEGEAEAKLDAINKRIQLREWWFNLEEEVAFGVPRVKIAITGSTGTFQYAEVVTESVSGATGYFAYIESGFIYLNLVSGMFTGGQTLTGGTSGATRAGGVYTAMTTGKLAYPSTIIKAWPSEAYPDQPRSSQSNGFFYNQDDRTFIYTLDNDLTMDVIRLWDFDEIPQVAAEYIAREAAMEFTKWKLPAMFTQDREREWIRAKIDCVNEDTRMREINVVNTPENNTVKGNRYRMGGDGAVRIG